MLPRCLSQDAVNRRRLSIYKKFPLLKPKRFIMEWFHKETVYIAMDYSRVRPNSFKGF